MASWGNQADDQYGQDMISPAGRRLEVTDINDDEHSALKATNSDNDGKALEVVGKTKLDGGVEIEGMAEITAYVPVFPNGQTVGLRVTHSNPAQGRALEVEGSSRFNGSVNMQQSLFVDGQTELGGNIATHVDSHATLKINDVNESNDAKIALHTINNSNNPTALSLKAEGTVDLDGIRMAAGGWINTSGQNLSIGTSEPTGNIRIGRFTKSTTITGNQLMLYVEKVILSGGLDGDPEEECELNLGTNDETLDVRISRPNQTTTVRGNLQVNGEFEGQGAMRALANLFVGTNENDGLIDANGANNNRDLKIGNTDLTTNNVILSRLGKLVDILGKLRINGNELILDNSSDLSVGSGVKFNSTGHGSQAPSIDVIISGICVYYYDSAGGHNNA